MNQNQFPLDSTELELLLAFEKSGGLTHLSDHLGRDASVVSRNLKKMAEKAPVLKKISGKWQLTPLGKKANDLTVSFLSELKQLMPSLHEYEKKFAEAFFGKRLVLLVVNAQQAFLDPVWGPSSTPAACENIKSLLTTWRAYEAPIVHVRHISSDPQHPFFLDARGARFMPGIAPHGEERTIEKSSASAFTNTGLGVDFEKSGTNCLLVVGFTAAECIDATAKQGYDLGFHVFVASDAAATFSLKADGEEGYGPHEIHKFTMQRLDKSFAYIMNTEQITSTIKRGI